MLLSVGFISLGQVCPPEGTGKNAKEKHANTLKNRSVIVNKARIPMTLSLDSVLVIGQDSARFRDSNYVVMDGFVVEFKSGESESCNCNSVEEKNHDIHIYVGKTPDAKKENCMICEITPPYKNSVHPDVKSMVGQRVVVEGFLFYDAEHKGNAKNTCKRCTNTWRATVWEIHPVTLLEVVK